MIGLFLCGCAGTTRPKPLVAPKDKSRFEERIDRLTENIVTKQKHTVAALSPVAVLPGSLKSAPKFTRLEEVVMERLEQRLLETNELISLSRQHWFAFREERPLDFFHTRGYTPSDMRHLVLYVVNVAADDVMEDLRVTISAYNSDNRAISGLTAAERFDYAPEQPARMLYESPPKRIPFPEGLEENPYTSMDRLCFSLAGELADAYKTGITAGDAVAADREVKVLLYIRPRSGVDVHLADAIGNTLQQAVVANRGFTCVVSGSDFGPMFEQIDFYKSRPQVFAIDDPQFLAGTVFLMADVFPHLSGKSAGVALRAVWRVDPLEDKSGAFVPDTTAGTYLSGFTAKSYLLATHGRSAGMAGGSIQSQDLKPGRLPAAVLSGPAAETAAVTAPAVKTAAVDPSVREAPKTYTLCFQGFSDPLSREIYPVLSRVPGLQSIRRTDDACGQGERIIGYILQCRCRPEILSNWMEANFRAPGGQVVPYRIQSPDDERVNVYYNGGFE